MNIFYYIYTICKDFFEGLYPQSRSDFYESKSNYNYNCNYNDTDYLIGKTSE